MGKLNRKKSESKVNNSANPYSDFPLFLHPSEHAARRFAGASTIWAHEMIGNRALIPVLYRARTR